MKLYQTPGGVWCGTEKEWIARMRAEGLEPKAAVRKTVDVPTSKKELMEFLSFHNVNVVNPTPPPTEITEPQPAAPTSLGAVPDVASTTTSNLDELFAAAPIKQQLRLAVVAIDAADARLP